MLNDLVKLKNFLKEEKELKKELDNITKNIKKLTPIVVDYLEKEELTNFNGVKLQTIRAVDKKWIKTNKPEYITKITKEQYPGVDNAPVEAIIYNKKIKLGE